MAKRRKAKQQRKPSNKKNLPQKNELTEGKAGGCASASNLNMGGLNIKNRNNIGGNMQAHNLERKQEETPPVVVEPQGDDNNNNGSAAEANPQKSENVVSQQAAEQPQEEEQEQEQEQEHEAQNERHLQEEVNLKAPVQNLQAEVEAPAKSERLEVAREYQEPGQTFSSLDPLISLQELASTPEQHRTLLQENARLVEENKRLKEENAQLKEEPLRKAEELQAKQEIIASFVKHYEETRDRQWFKFMRSDRWAALNSESVVILPPETKEVSDENSTRLLNSSSSSSSSNSTSYSYTAPVDDEEDDDEEEETAAAATTNAQLKTTPTNRDAAQTIKMLKAMDEKEVDEKLVEIFLHATTNPQSRTAQVLREQYDFDVTTQESEPLLAESTEEERKKEASSEHARVFEEAYGKIYLGVREGEGKEERKNENQNHDNKATLAALRDFFEKHQYGYFSHWHESGSMAPNKRTIEEIIRHAIRNPKSGTAKILRSEYGVDVTRVPKAEKERLRPALETAWQKAREKEKAFLSNLFTEHKADRDTTWRPTSSKWSRNSEENAQKIPLTSVIDHARESRLTRWILSWLPVPRLFYSGGRTYSLFKTQTGIDPRNERNKKIPSAEIAAKVIVRGR